MIDVKTGFRVMVIGTGPLGMEAQHPKHQTDTEDSAVSCGAHANDENEDDLRVGFVFEKPVRFNIEAEVISFLELFNRVKKPSLTDCIALAKSIATNLRYLQAVDWLHKGLRKREHFVVAGLELYFSIRSDVHDGLRIF